MKTRLRLAAWLLLIPLAVPAAEFKDVPEIPQLPQAVSPQLEAPEAAAALTPSAADAAEAISAIPQISLPQAAVAPAAAAAPVKGVEAALSAQSRQIAKAIASDPSGRRGLRKLDAVFSGSRDRGDSGAVSSRGGRFNAGGAVSNDEGMIVTGRTAAQYREIKRLEAELTRKGVDLGESMNVMDDAYAEIRAKLTAIEHVARARGVTDSNTHLLSTLTWVDGVITDDSGRRIAVHTTRVFFHPAPNRSSEIQEGIRRVAKTLDQQKVQFAPGGAAESALGRFDQVVLAFDTRGYDEIKSYIKSREHEFGPRFRFEFVDEMGPTPKNVAQMREDVRRLAAHFPENQAALANIYDGVTYSRYVGLLLELKTIEYFVDRGYRILESGRDFFDPQGQYKTEFDAVVKSPQGQILIVEAKSARVPLTLAKGAQDKAELDKNGMLDVMEEKFLYKLRMYQRDRAIIDAYVRKHYGDGPIGILFSTDLGGSDRKAAREGVLVWKDPGQADLKTHLEAEAPKLSAEYGYPVSFLFLNSHPGEDPMLFYQEPTPLDQWHPTQQGGGRRDRRSRRSRRRR